LPIALKPLEKNGQRFEACTVNYCFCLSKTSYFNFIEDGLQEPKRRASGGRINQKKHKPIKIVLNTNFLIFKVLGLDFAIELL